MPQNPREEGSLSIIRRNDWELPGRFKQAVFINPEKSRFDRIFGAIVANSVSIANDPYEYDKLLRYKDIAK